MTHTLIPAQCPIPELASERRFVTWRYERRGNNLTKVPYGRGGVRASSTDPSTWMSWEEAAREAQGADGVGVMLGGGLVGIDLDWKGRQESDFPEAAVWLIQALDSYTEVSPSGKGVHILLLGEKPQGSRSRVRLDEEVGLEVYGGGRFFTLTGKRVGARGIVERQEALDWLCRTFLMPEGEEGVREEIREEKREEGATKPSPLRDEQVVEMALRNPRTARLWNGDWSGYPSRSEADLALAGFLMWATGNDAARADALFRRSRLYRKKWDERRGSATYGQLTLARAWCRNPLSAEVVRWSKGGKEVKLPPPMDRAFAPFTEEEVRKFGMVRGEDGRVGLPMSDDDGRPVDLAWADERLLVEEAARGCWVWGEWGGVIHIALGHDAPALAVGLRRAGKAVFIGVGKEGLTLGLAKRIAAEEGPVALWLGNRGEEYLVTTKVAGQLVAAGVDRRRIIFPAMDGLGRSALEVLKAGGGSSFRDRLMRARHMSHQIKKRQVAVLSFAAKQPRKHWSVREVLGRGAATSPGNRGFRGGSPYSLEVAQALSRDDLFVLARQHADGDVERAREVLLYAYSTNSRARNAINCLVAYHLTQDERFRKRGKEYQRGAGKEWGEIRNRNPLEVIAELVRAFFSLHKQVREGMYQRVMKERHRFWCMIHERFGNRTWASRLLSCVYAFWSTSALAAIGVLLE